MSNIPDVGLPVIECIMRALTLKPSSVELQNRVKQGLSTTLKEAAGG
jgi:hypothetical protein